MVLVTSAVVILISTGALVTSGGGLVTSPLVLVISTGVLVTSTGVIIVPTEVLVTFTGVLEVSNGSKVGRCSDLMQESAFRVAASTHAFKLEETI